MALKIKLKGDAGGDKTDFEKEQEDEIRHDSHKKRRAGGSAKGHMARGRLDRPHRQMGGGAGMPATAPAAGANPDLTRALQARRLGQMNAGVPAGTPSMTGSGTVSAAGRGYARGGATNGQKWVPGLGDEQTQRQDQSRGDPILEKDMDHGVVKRGGKLTAGERQSLPKSDFALPGKGEGPKGAGSGSYPINNPSHARNALARVSQHGSPAEKAAVRSKVHAKYPDIGMDK